MRPPLLSPCAFAAFEEESPRLTLHELGVAHAYLTLCSSSLLHASLNRRACEPRFLAGVPGPARWTLLPTQADGVCPHPGVPAAARRRARCHIRCHGLARLLETLPSRLMVNDSVRRYAALPFGESDDRLVRNVDSLFLVSQDCGHLQLLRVPPRRAAGSTPWTTTTTTTTCSCGRRCSSA
eukprot:5487468-Pleurochrysis_carterae.AAC.2